MPGGPGERERGGQVCPIKFLRSGAPGSGSGGAQWPVGGNVPGGPEAASSEKGGGTKAEALQEDQSGFLALPAGTLNAWAKITQVTLVLTSISKVYWT